MIILEMLKLGDLSKYLELTVALMTKRIVSGYWVLATIYALKTF